MSGGASRLRKRWRGTAAVALSLACGAGVGGCRGPAPRLGALPSGYRLVYAEDFASPAALAAWRPTDPAAWRHGGDGTRTWMEQHAASDYRPPHRSPVNIALLAAPVFGDFVLEAEVQQTGREYGHRDMCVVFAYAGPARYAYAHIASVADETAHQVHVVRDAPRTPVTTSRSSGVGWGEGAWHVVRMEREAGTGAARVYFDDPAAPVLVGSVTDPASGLIGLGTFDDTCRIAWVRLWAPEAPSALPSPRRAHSIVRPR